MIKEADTAIVYHEGHNLHQTRPVDPCETGERVELIKAALESSGTGMSWVTPKVTEDPLIRETHDRNMLKALKSYSEMAVVGDRIFTSFCHDSTFSTPITRGTYDQAVLSASCSLTASEMIRNKQALLTFSLSRPPGHHAGRDFYHGFCFINNGALAVRNLRQNPCKVAILDFDVHHCNGTQDIFYNTGEALVVSLHADPNQVFPNTGFANECGEGKGRGLIANLPFEVGISATRYLERLNEAIKLLSDYHPDVLVVEAGFDAHRADHAPGGSSLTELSEDSYGAIGSQIGSLDIPCCVILEGGYALKYLPDSFMAFFTALEQRLVKGRRSL